MQSVFKAVLTFSIILLVLTDLISIICMIDTLNDLRIYINNPDYFSDDSFGAPKSAMGLVFAIGFMSATLACLLALLTFKHIASWFRTFSLSLLPLLIMIANLTEIIMR